MRMQLLMMLLFSTVCFGCASKLKQFNAEVFYDNDMRILVPVKIGDTTINMLWDTGATQSAFSEELANRLSIDIDTNKSIKALLFKSKVDTQIDGELELIVIDAHLSKPVIMEIGGLNISSDVAIIKNQVADPGMPILGNSTLLSHYYAMYVTDRYMTLSETPITFDPNMITDSIEFQYGDNNRMVSKVKVDSTYLNLLLDSGMLHTTQFKDYPVLYFDFILMYKDSTETAAKVYREISKRSNFNITLYNKTVSKGTCGKDVTINSYPVITYILSAPENPTSNFEGVLNMAFIARFDVLYCNPFDRIVKLYKIKGKNSLMKDTPFYEYIKGIEGVEYLPNGDSVIHKDAGELVKYKLY